MSRARYVVVQATTSPKVSFWGDPYRSFFILFRINEHYSMRAAQRFLDENHKAFGEAFGGPLTVRREVYKLKHFADVLRRKRRLPWWNGPFTLSGTV